MGGGFGEIWSSIMPDFRIIDRFPLEKIVYSLVFSE